MVAHNCHTNLADHFDLLSLRVSVFSIHCVFAYSNTLNASSPDVAELSRFEPRTEPNRAQNRTESEPIRAQNRADSSPEQNRIRAESSPEQSNRAQNRVEPGPGSAVTWTHVLQTDPEKLKSTRRLSSQILSGPQSISKFNCGNRAVA